MQRNDSIDFQGTLAPIILLIFQREKPQIEPALFLTFLVVYFFRRVVISSESEQFNGKEGKKKEF